MTKIDGDNHNLKCNSGEVITVEVTSSNTVHGVNVDLDGTGGPLPSGQKFTFPMDRSPRTLTLLFTFANAAGDGGRYDVTVTGSGGGDVSTEAVIQSFGIPTTATSYDFRL